MSLANLRKNPGFTVTVLITLTLAIGANSTIFTLANALLLTSLPVSRPDRLLEVSTLDRKGEKGNFSIPEFELIHQEGGIFSSAFAWRGGAIQNFEMNGVPFAGLVDRVAGDYYETLGIRPALGRFLTQKDSPSRVAVIAFKDWQEHYQGDPAVIGKTVLLDAEPYTIIGVHPQSFPGLIRENAADATIPFELETLQDRKNTGNTVIGRLRDGVSSSQARARLQSIAPRDEARTIQVETAARGVSFLRNLYARPLYVLLGLVALLLLLACVNLANVALARALRRAAEMSIRAALGAGRWRLLRDSLVESLLLSMWGIVPGLAFATWGSRQIARFVWHGYVPLALPLVPDLRVALFTSAAAIAAGALFGLLPAWRVGRHDPALLIHGGSPKLTAGPGHVGRILVVTQIALSFAILAGALLFSRSVGNVLRRDPGFSSDRLLVAQLFPRGSYRGLDQPAYYRQLLESLRSTPGVTAASFAHPRPIGGTWLETVLPADVHATYHLVAPGFFDTVGIRVLRGRDFTLHDDESRPLVAIVSQRLARLVSPSADALGRRVRIGDEKSEFEIVGVAGDAALDDPRHPEAPAIYVSSFQRPALLGYSTAILRTPGDPARLAGALRARIESLGREYPLGIQTVRDEYQEALMPERMLTLVTSFFGASGLLLAAVGLYGLLSYTVSRRTGEISIRVAVGATPRDIIALILCDAATLVAIGLAAGLTLALAGARVISGFLFGLSGHDPATLALAGGSLIVVALFASLIPAIRALLVDPVTGLRC